MTFIDPCRCFVIISLDIYKPIPVPWDLCFVVKYGSKILSIIFVLIPPALSFISIVKYSFSLLALINIKFLVDCISKASIALLKILRRT